MTALPVRVYRVFFAGSPMLSSALRPSEIVELLKGVNWIWAAVDIHWRILSTEDLDIADLGEIAFQKIQSKSELRRRLIEISPIVPEVVARRLWRICLLARFPIRAGGVYVPETGTIFCSERAASGGLNYAVFAHELGHSFGLRHSSLTGDLMNPSSLREIHRAVTDGVLDHDYSRDSLFSEASRATVSRNVELGPYNFSSVDAD